MDVALRFWRSLIPLILLIFLSATVLILPARHVLLSFWPAPLIEVVYLDEEGQSRIGLFEAADLFRLSAVRFRPDASGARSPRLRQFAQARVQKQTRPRSATVIDLANGDRLFAYLAGYRPRDDQNGDRSVRPAPQDFRGRSVDFPGELILFSPQGERKELAKGEWRGWYQPNRMNIPARMRLLVRRMAEDRRLRFESQKPLNFHGPIRPETGGPLSSTSRSLVQARKADTVTQPLE